MCKTALKLFSLSSQDKNSNTMTIMKKNYTGSFRFQTTGIIQLLHMESNCVWHHEQQEQQMRRPCQLRSWMGGSQFIHDSHPSETANQCQLKTHFNVFILEFADHREMFKYFSPPSQGVSRALLAVLRRAESWTLWIYLHQST